MNRDLNYFQQLPLQVNTVLKAIMLVTLAISFCCCTGT